MVAITFSGLISELDEAVKGGSPERRIQMLRQVTDLFLSDADRLNETQIGVFDDVLMRLIERLEAGALTQLSATFADVHSAPKDVVRQLAFHEEAAVATPILAKSERLSERDLIEIASTRGQQHLLAISGRSNLNEALTEVLLARGDSGVSHALAGNTGARFSNAGYATLAQSAERDDSLAEKLGRRRDIPFNILRELLSKATEAVRSRLLAAAPPALREMINAAIQSIAEQIDMTAPRPIDYTEAENAVLALNRAGDLTDSAVNRFAIDRNFKNVTAALSLLASVKIDAVEPLLSNPRPDGLIVTCRAARLSWSTTLMILRNRPKCPPISKEQLQQGHEVFEALSLSAAQRTIRFWSARSSAKKADFSYAAVGG